MYIIDINISENREVILSSRQGGNIHENNSTLLNFTVPDKYSEYYKYLDIDMGGKGKTQTVVSSGKETKFSYSLPGELTSYPTLYLQLVLKKGSEVFKSNLFNIVFNGSICATQVLENEYKDSIQTIMETKADLEVTKELENRKLEKSVFYDFQKLQEEINTMKTDNSEFEKLEENFYQETEFLDKRVTQNETDIEILKDDKVSQPYIDSLEQRLFEEREDINNSIANLETEVEKTNDNMADKAALSSLKTKLEKELDKRINYIRILPEEFDVTIDSIYQSGIYHLCMDYGTEYNTSILIVSGYDETNCNQMLITSDGEIKKRNIYFDDEMVWHMWRSWKTISVSENDINDLSDQINNVNKRLVDFETEATERNENQKAYSDATYSNALKGTASGKVIRIDDVSPIDHTANVKLTGDNITDFSAVKLIKYGKNLFSVDDSTISTTTVISEEVDGNNYTLKGNYGLNDLAYSTGVFTIKLNTPLPTVKTIRVSMYVTLLEQGERSNKIQMMEGNVKATVIHTLNVGERQKITLSINFPSSFTHLSSLVFYLNNNKVLFELDTLQICYEEIPEEIYIPESDGTVEGLAMAYPTTTLLTDTEGVTINVEYNKDINKTIEKLTNTIISLGGNI